MFDSTDTGLGVAELVTARSGIVTVTLSDAVLSVRSGSVPVWLTVTESVITVPVGVAAVTATTRLNVGVAPDATVAFAVQIMLPVPPTAGTVPQVQPAGGVIDTKVVF